MMKAPTRILTEPDHTIPHIIEAVGDMKDNDVIQIQINSYSRPLIVLEALEKAYENVRFIHETFKHNGTQWMYVTVKKQKTHSGASQQCDSTKPNNHRI